MPRAETPWFRFDAVAVPQPNAHPYSEAYVFNNSDGTVVRFGPGDHLRAWRNIPGPAHDLLAAFNNRCLHSPGSGDVFREDALVASLDGVRVLEVVSRAETLEEVDRRLNRGLNITGLPWTVFANCQDPLSWIVTGRASSYQRDAAVVAVVGVGFGLLLAFNSSEAPKRQRRRTR